MNIDKSSRIGIWGFGVVGKSVADYLLSLAYSNITIMDKRTPTEDEQHYLKKNNIAWHQQCDEETFFNFCDILIPSPGVNIKLHHYATYISKWLHELDIFYNNFNKPIIAITGSVGKTSTTHILGKLLQHLSIPVAIGGNIGIPMLDLISRQNNVDYALLEVSSFQLLHCTQFAPQYAVITNIYPNHLDYHTTEDEFLCAMQMV